MKYDFFKRRRLYALITCCYIAALLAIFVLIGNGGSIDTFMSEPKPEGKCVYIIMYHSILKDPSRTGKYVVTPDSLKSDILYLKENGYTTVFVSELADYANGKCDLPEKPVVLSFDDGYYNNCVYLLPILESLDAKACIAIVGEYAQLYTDNQDRNPNYSHMAWSDISEAAASGRVEIMGHSYCLHKSSPRLGANKKRGESYESYSKLLTFDTMKLQELVRSNCGLTMRTYAYPYGSYCKESEAILKELGFSATLTCCERKNIITDASSLFELGRFNRDGRLSTEEFMKKMFSK